MLLLLSNQLCQDSILSVFRKSELETFKNGKSQLLNMARSRYFVILIKSQKGLKLVSSL